MKFDTKVKKGSRIAGYPKPLQPLAVIAREIYTGFLMKKGPGTYPYKGDGIASKHIMGFLNDERFQLCYRRAVKAGGFDYGIPYRVHQALWCSRMAQRVEGDYVEIGTGRGFMMSAVLSDIPEWNASNRRMWLFDTFSPYKLDEDGAQTEESEKSRYYATSVEATRKNFSEWSRIEVVPGDVFDTLHSATIEKIAFLHLDLNYAEAECFCLESLYSRLAPGALILMDDYAFNGCESQHAALNSVAEKLGLSILTTPSGQGIAIR